jgi:hypothetical protein
MTRNVDIPAKEQIDRIAKAVLQVPSAENCQPWQIVIDKNVIEILHLSQRARLATYPDDVSVLGLGMIAETIDLVCKDEGLEARKTFFLENRSDHSPWLKADIHGMETVPDPLVNAIFLRHTDRRQYNGGSLDDPVFQKACNEAAKFSEANLYFANQYPEKYLKLLSNADEIVMNWEKLRHDLMQWARFTDRDIKRTRDGMTWRSFLRGEENWIYYLRSRVWRLAARLDYFPAFLQALETRFFDDSAELSPTSYDDGAGIGCITVGSDRTDALLVAGRLMLRIWLLFNLNKYGFQPLTNLSITVYALRCGNFKLPEELSHLMENGYETLQEVFGFSNGELPVICFRTGLSVGDYPSKTWSLRREEHIRYRS